MYIRSLKPSIMTFGGGSEQEFIGKLTQITLDHLADEHFGGRELALQAGMSLSTLSRRLQSIHQKSPNTFIREIRLHKAMELLQQGSSTISEIAFQVGFGSPTYFSKCFHDHFGYAPGEVKKKMEDGSLPLPEDSLPAEDIPEAEPTVPVKQDRVRRTYRLAALAGTGLLILALVLFFLTQKGDFSYQLRGQEKSIAVLPFKNLSPEANNQYFADGITEDILNHLFRISELRVISRTTAERFRDSQLPSPEIAKSMGVNYLLEGSVRKQGEQVRISVQLIDGQSDHHLWSENYDRQLADIFYIQSDIAQNVARELRAVLSPGEIESLERPISQSIGAYDYFLRGKDYLKRSLDYDDFNYASLMFQKAVEIDPGFALAWTGLSVCSRNVYWLGYDRSEENITRGKQYLEKAKTLAPGLYEVKLEEAYSHYHYDYNYEESLKILEKLIKDYPNHDEIYLLTGAVYRRMGQFRRSLEYFEHAISLNPLEWLYWETASYTFRLLKEYAKAEEFELQAIYLNPSYANNYEIMISLYMSTGQISKAKEFLSVNEKNFIPENLNFIKSDLEYLEKNYDKALQYILSVPGTDTKGLDDFQQKDLALGLIYRSVPNQALAQRHFEKARDTFLDELGKIKNDPRIFKNLALAYAGLGEKEKALEAAGKSLDLLNFQIDAYGAYFTELDVVKVLVMLNEQDQALEKLDYIVKHHGFISVEILKLGPFWDPVREHHKFQEIINNPEYQIRL